MILFIKGNQRCEIQYGKVLITVECRLCLGSSETQERLQQFSGAWFEKITIQNQNDNC